MEAIDSVKDGGPSEMDLMRETDPELVSEIEAEEKPEIEAVEEEKTEEVKEEPKEEPQKTVPLGALHEERQRRKELQQQVRESQQRQQAMEQRFNQFVERMQQPQTPSYEDDPGGYLVAQQEQLRQQVEQQNQYITQSRQQQEQQQAVQAVVGRYSADSQAFNADHPDYADAYRHTAGLRHQQYLAMGMNPQEAQARAQNDELNMVQYAYSQGMNPAEVVYNMAKATGFQRKAETASVDKQIDTEVQAQKAAKSLSGGAAQSQKLSLSDLADLDGDDFDKAFNEYATSLRGY